MPRADDGRDTAGRFAIGNPGGPGRPRRAIETDYLRMLAERLTPDAWRAIIDTAIDDAKTGDARARDWLTRYALGATPPTLWALAVADAAGITADDEIRHAIERGTMEAAERAIYPPGAVARLGAALRTMADDNGR